MNLKNFMLGMVEAFGDATSSPHDLESYDAGRSFFIGYVTCALWSSTDESDESGGNPMDDNYSREDIAPACLDTMRAECLDFIHAARSPLRAATNREGYTWERAGHDFWLTRNGHGAGFWDRSELDARGIGRKLTDHAHAAGGRDLYIGDDGKIYQ